jgi:HNH endonuclease
MELPREAQSQGYERRKSLFDIYSFQLELLKTEGLLSGIDLIFDKTYICPACLAQFSEDDLSEDSPNMLTLEDAPPKSLGGKANTLTCKKCNNTFGHKIDFHLSERLSEIDSRAFLPMTQMKAKFVHKGRTVQGTVAVDARGEIKVIHAIKNNNPEKLNSYVSDTGKGDAIGIEFSKSRVEIHRLEIALLKTAYILAFAKFGYAFMLDKSYDRVREQLQYPEKMIYPEGFWTMQEFGPEHEGIHMILESGIEGFFVIFSLNTGTSVKRFGVYLPLPGKSPEDAITTLKEKTGGFSLQLEKIQGNYITNIEDIVKLSNSIKKLS